MKRGGDINALPPAKRNRADSGADQQGEDAGKDIDENDLTQFQKQAIWQRMQEYKREVERANEQIGEFEKLRDDYEKKASLFCSSLAMISEDISLTLGKLDGRLPSNGTADSFQILDILKSFEESNEPRLDGVRRTLADQLSKIVSLSMQGQMQTDDASLVDSLNTRCHTLATENASLQAKITSQLQKLLELEEKLDDVRGARIVLERKLDRAKATAVLVKDSSVDVMQDDSTTSTLATVRIKEIEELKVERMELLEKMDAIRLQSIQAGITEDRIRESPLYQNLEAEFQYHRNENMCLKNRIDKLLIEYEELVSDRRKISEGFNEELGNAKNSFQDQINMLQADLNRVRENRNGLQSMLELRRAKDEADIVHNQEIRMIANSRKDRITFLERRLEILKDKAASEMPGTFWIRFFNEKPDGNPFEELRKDLKAAQDRVQQLEHDLEASKQASEEQMKLAELIVSEKLLKEEVETLKSRLHSSSTSTQAELDAKVKDLMETVAFLKKSETRLAKEVDDISKAWESVEESAMKKVINLTDKEELILRLTAEKTKMEQKCSISSKLAHASGGYNANLKRQSEKQLEQIRKLEEREKSLVQQLQTIEKDFSTKTIAADLHRRKVSELTQKNAELTDRVEKQSIKYQEVEKLLKEKNKALVDESDSKRRLLEQAEILKQKLEKQAKVEPTGEASSLQREYEALKQTFKCPSCRTNFWTHVLLRCKHVLCKSCIDDQINSRSRKCPSCSVGFSTNEFTKLFLP